MQAVGVTGSGRYLIGDLAGADVVVNEITAHATASAFICPEVDTIFEIGGQDSKYVRLENGLVKDFTMNKACAAGTGSFLEEQAEKLGISIKRDFARLALAAEHPVDCGEQCTVFIDSEVVRHQQRGTPVSDIAGGLGLQHRHQLPAQGRGKTARGRSYPVSGRGGLQYGGACGL